MALMVMTLAEDNIRCGVTDEDDAVFTDWYGSYSMAIITGVGDLTSPEGCLFEA